MTDFIFLDSKITAEDDCRHETKRHLLLGRKAMTNLNSLLKSKDISFLTKVRWMWELDHKEGWVPKNWCFQILVLEDSWESLGQQRKSNQSIISERDPEYSLEGLILNLKLQYFGHLMWRADSLEKILMLGKIEGRGEGDDRGWDGWMAWETQWTWV